MRHKNRYQWLKMKLGFWEKIASKPKGGNHWHFNYTPDWVRKASKDWRREGKSRAGESKLYDGDSFRYKVWDNDETVKFYRKLRAGRLRRFLQFLR